MPRRKIIPRPIPRPSKKKTIRIKDNGEWKLAPANQNRLTALPPEIHLKIISHMNPMDTVCFSLTNKYLYNLLSPLITTIPLTIGAPDSHVPIPYPSGCHHCVPVLFYPAHCELHFHLRNFIPEEWVFCSSCAKFTRCEDKGFSDSHEFCGVCGTNYKRRFERGRRMIEMGGKDDRERLKKWYNTNTQEK